MAQQTWSSFLQFKSWYQLWEEFLDVDESLGWGKAKLGSPLGTARALGKGRGSDPTSEAIWGAAEQGVAYHLPNASYSSTPCVMLAQLLPQQARHPARLSSPWKTAEFLSFRLWKERGAISKYQAPGFYFIFFLNRGSSEAFPPLLLFKGCTSSCPATSPPSS